MPCFREADFRYALVRIRENAESIAFYGGEHREQELAKTRLNKALSRTVDVVNWQRNLEFFTNSYRYVNSYI
jgi:putative ATP-binding cassette transporter